MDPLQSVSDREAPDDGASAGEGSPCIVRPADVEVRSSRAGFQLEPGPQQPFTSSPPTAKAPKGSPTPLPKRPRGRFFVGAMLAGICGLVGHALWSVFLQHRAYGLVTGNVAYVSAPWDGFVESHAAGSAAFAHRETLASLDSLRLRHEVDQLRDQLRMAQAELDAEVSRLRWQAQDQIDLGTRAAAQHHEARGNLLAQQVLLERLSRESERAKALVARQAMSPEKRDAAVLDERGQRKKVDQLELAAALWKSRAELVRAFEDSGSEQLAPMLARIENLRNEIHRLRENLSQGQLKAPFDCFVVTRRKLTGERVEALEPVAEILQKGSIEAVLYLTQKDADRLKTGDKIMITVEPAPREIPCTVLRFGKRLEPAPASIERFYWSNEPLLPVYLKPDRQYGKWMSDRLGSVVRW